MTAQSRTPNKRDSRKNYKKVAVVETSLAPGDLPRHLAENTPGVVRIIETWDSLYVGKADGDSQYYRALDDAQELIKRLMVKDALAHKRKRIAEAHRP